MLKNEFLCYFNILCPTDVQQNDDKNQFSAFSTINHNLICIFCCYIPKIIFGLMVDRLLHKAV